MVDDITTSDDPGEYVTEDEAYLLTFREEFVYSAEHELDDRFNSLSGAVGDLDNALAEQDHLQVQQLIADIREHLRGVDRFLIQVRVLSDLTPDAWSRGVFDLGESLLADVAVAQPVLDGTRGLPKDDSGLDDDEWAEAVSEAVGQMADDLRSTGTLIEETWSCAEEAAQDGGLDDVVQQVLLLHAHARELQAGYDEWFHLLGILSNVAPGRLTGAAEAAVATFEDWSRAQAK